MSCPDAGTLRLFEVSFHSLPRRVITWTQGLVDCHRPRVPRTSPPGPQISFAESEVTARCDALTMLQHCIW